MDHHHACPRPPGVTFAFPPLLSLSWLPLLPGLFAMPLLPWLSPLPPVWPSAPPLPWLSSLPPPEPSSAPVLLPCVPLPLSSWPPRLLAPFSRGLLVLSSPALVATSPIRLPSSCGQPPHGPSCTTPPALSVTSQPMLYARPPQPPFYRPLPSPCGQPLPAPLFAPLPLPSIRPPSSS